MIYPTFRCRREDMVAKVKRTVPFEDYQRRYYDWLLYHAGCRNMRRDGEGYRLLLNTLISMEPRWLVPMDENRRDCMEYRHEFTLLTGYRYDDETDLDDGAVWPPSVFELLMGISALASYTGRGGKDESEWFWEWIVNLGLDGAYDGSGVTEDQIRRTVDKWLDRRYSRTGKGSIFPMPADKVSENFKEKEIWYQLCEYLMCYYPMGFDD